MLERWRSDGFLKPLLWNHIRALFMKRHKHHNIKRKNNMTQNDSNKQLSNMLILHEGPDSGPPTPDLRSRNTTPDFRSHYTGTCTPYTCIVRANRYGRGQKVLNFIRSYQYNVPVDRLHCNFIYYILRLK